MRRNDRSTDLARVLRRLLNSRLVLPIRVVVPALFLLLSWSLAARAVPAHALAPPARGDREAGPGDVRRQCLERHPPACGFSRRETTPPARVRALRGVGYRGRRPLFRRKDTPAGSAPVAGTEQAPSFVIIVTDDQRWDSLGGEHTNDGLPLMPRTLARLGAEGLTFHNAFVTTPLCCPSRASILTGRYAHGHGVRTNRPPDGGATVFDDSATVATWLKSAGYRTALIGKYLNRYELLVRGRSEPYIPPGWDTWTAFVRPGYFRYSLVEGGQRTRYGRDPGDYSTDVLLAKALAFIAQTPAATPFFLFFNPRAPHLPALPAPRHSAQSVASHSWRPPDDGETDRRDKPAWVRTAKPTRPVKLTRMRAHMLDSLRAVDEAVGAIIDELIARGRDSNTLVLYLSDNGFAWGEHGLSKKRCPYEACIRTPFLVRYPPLVRPGETSDALVLNIDIAPTLLALARTSPNTSIDGKSLVPLLSGNQRRVRNDFLIEGWEGKRAFAGVRDSRWKYVEHAGGEVELYDLERDPHELVNLAVDSAFADRLAAMAARLRQLRPEWPNDSLAARGQRKPR